MLLVNNRWMFLGVMGFLGLPLFAALLSIAAVLERWAFPPVSSMEFTEIVCDESDAIAYGYLNKARDLKFTGLTVMLDTVPPRRTLWRGLDQPENSPASRPPGEQAIDLWIQGGCDIEFTLFVEHKAAHGFWEIHTIFGPFGGDDEQGL